MLYSKIYLYCLDTFKIEFDRLLKIAIENINLIKK